MEIAAKCSFVVVITFCLYVTVVGQQTYFDVTSYGAKGNGISDDTNAFLAAWNAACSSAGDVRLVAPKGTYLIGPINFKGPCRQVSSLTFQVKGYIKATTNLGSYGDTWVQFGWVNRLNLTGGIFDGQGASAWPHNNCPKTWSCKLLPTSIKFVSTTNTWMQGVTSLNSKFFHIALVGCKGFHATGITVSAPATSPNTDGIHLQMCDDVTISRSNIATGDDCISIGQGNTRINIDNINCGPGHGISVGSLGKYAYEKDVRGLVVRDSTLTNTDNGLRIKTWASSPGVLAAANMTFDNIIMNNVYNPIIIDQTYCPYASCESSVPSKVRISDIFFNNVRGTSTSAIAVTLRCSSGNPCQNVHLTDVHLNYFKGPPSAASCANIKAIYNGVQIPPPCV